MPPRQLFIFKFGCWATLLTAAVHMAGHVAGPQTPVNDVERQLHELATTYRYALPGGAERSLMDFVDGFSLIFALLLATVGTLGLVIERRARHDRALMAATARTLAMSSAVLLVISLMKFFIVPTLFIALMTVSFAVAAVESPESV